MAESLLGPDRMRRLAIVCVLVAASACAPRVHRNGPDAASPPIAELWIDPRGAPRDLRLCPATVLGATHPEPDGRYDVVARDTNGFSITYRVRDARGGEWNVKIGPEAQTEVVASRIAWAIGYHQVPSFFVERWIGVDHGHGSQFGGGRFRPHRMPLKLLGTWSWQQNPFVGTTPYEGLLALMMLLNSTDLKNDNNALYAVEGDAREHASRWYVVKDLGASLGETGRFDPRRGNIDAFEREPFIRGTDGNRLLFGYHGRHQELLPQISPDAIRWVSERLSAITDRQWRDAFSAGHFDAATTGRYVARIRQKVDEGLALR